MMNMKPLINRLISAPTFAPCLRLVSAAFATCLVASCSTTAPQIAQYDLGVAALTSSNVTSIHNPAACQLPALQLIPIEAPSVFQTEAMRYRLLYINDQQNWTYANHRWTMPPTILLTQQIKNSLADAGVTLLEAGMTSPDKWQLKVALIDFSQYFNSAQSSYAQIKIRATLLNGTTLQTQTTLLQRADTKEANAPAGASAMRVASDALMSDLKSWLCQQKNPQ